MPPVVSMFATSSVWRPVSDVTSKPIPNPLSAETLRPSTVTSTLVKSKPLSPVTTEPPSTLREPPSCRYARLNPPMVVPSREMSSLPSRMSIPYVCKLLPPELAATLTTPLMKLWRVQWYS